MGDYWVIVNGIATPQQAAFLLTPAEVRAQAHRGEKNGRVSYWLQPKAYDVPEFRERWERIGRGDRDDASHV